MLGLLDLLKQDTTGELEVYEDSLAKMSANLSDKFSPAGVFFFFLVLTAVLIAFCWLAVILDGDEKQLCILMKQLSESVGTIKSIAQCYGASMLPGSKCCKPLYYLQSGAR